tara:strand:- start:348 stop:704 length:357 start_codon:yes stop_codon:yes gene_type:complete
MEKDYGDFEEVKDEETPANQPEQAPARARMPRNKELIGRITQRLGGNRMEVNCTDGKSRNCRVPGRYRRRLWLRPKDIVIIVPWEDNDDKGDVIYKYRKNEANQLRKKKVLESIKDDF